MAHTFIQHLGAEGGKNRISQLLIIRPLRRLPKQSSKLSKHNGAYVLLVSSTKYAIYGIVVTREQDLARLYLRVHIVEASDADTVNNSQSVTMRLIIHTTIERNFT